MDALTLLTQRKSNKKLTAPAPSQVQLEQMFQAALHAPDHGKLEPYHFVVIQGTGLSKLESLFKAAVAEFKLGKERLKKTENFARRTPMVIAVIAKINHEVKKVPGWEQMLTAGAATYAIQLAGNALGFESFWATGPLVEGRELREAFGLPTIRTARCSSRFRRWTIPAMWVVSALAASTAARCAVANRCC